MRGGKSDQKRVTSSVGSLQNIGLAKMFHQVFETCYRNLEQMFWPTQYLSI